jgi:hypothetical protein
MRSQHSWAFYDTATRVFSDSPLYSCKSAFEGEVVSVYTMKAYGGCGGIHPQILNLKD